MVSLWEKESLLSYNVIVIGAGISGLSTAASLKEKKPELNLLVIERGSLPTGASTRNAGFACFGSLSELVQDRKQLGDEGMKELVMLRKNGLQKTINRLGSNRIGYQQKGGYELLNPVTHHYMDEMQQVNELLQPIFRQPVFRKSPLLSTFGFANTTELICNPLEGQLHTGQLMAALWHYCGELGVKIITGTPVIAIDPSPSGFEIRCPDLRFHTSACAVCTNAFTLELLSDPLDISPGRGMILLVEPKGKLPFEGSFHYDEGFYYFRDFQGKILFGGGRNVDLETETTLQFGINPLIEKKLHQDLQEIIIPGMKYETLMRWSGIMAFGTSKMPVIKQLDSGVYVGARLGGMGMALGSSVGEELASRIITTHF